MPNSYIEVVKNDGKDKVTSIVEQDGMVQIRVSGGSQIKETAACIFKFHEHGQKVQVRAIGASAVNQMYKALATTCILFAQKGKIARIRPGYDKIDIWDRNRKKRVEKTIMVAYIDVED